MFWTIIIIFTILFCVLFGIGGFLISHWFFKPSNNPYKARIYVDGINKPYEGKYEYSSQKGSVYSYKNGKLTVVVPDDYGFDFHYHKRTIFIDSFDHLIATNKGDKKALPNNHKTELLEDLWQSHIGAEAIKAIKAKQSISMGFIILILVGLVIAGAIGYFVHTTPNNTQQISQNTTVPKPNITPPSMDIQLDNKGDN